MYGLKQKLLEEEKCLKEILSGIGEPKADALEGTLRISMDKNKVRYFHHFRMKIIRKRISIFQRQTKNFRPDWRKIHMTINCAIW